MKPVERWVTKSKTKPNEHHGDAHKEIFAPRKERGRKRKGQVTYGVQGSYVGITVVF